MACFWFDSSIIAIKRTYVHKIFALSSTKVIWWLLAQTCLHQEMARKDYKCPENIVSYIYCFRWLMKRQYIKSSYNVELKKYESSICLNIFDCKCLIYISIHLFSFLLIWTMLWKTIVLSCLATKNAVQKYT